jgi:hypothetical protein
VTNIHVEYRQSLAVRSGRRVAVAHRVGGKGGLETRRNQ